MYSYFSVTFGANGILVDYSPEYNVLKPYSDFDENITFPPSLSDILRLLVEMCYESNELAVRVAWKEDEFTYVLEIHGDSSGERHFLDMLFEEG